MNAHISPVDKEQLRKGLGCPESEEPVAFIVVGNPTDEFIVPMSRRKSLEDIIQEC